MRLDALYQVLKIRLNDAGIEQPGREARFLVRHAFGLQDADFITKGYLELDAENLLRLEALIVRRAAGEPLSRIVGQSEFWGLPFVVTPSVLDPRPDTETIIEHALVIFRERPPQKILDLGTGSGCLVISLLHVWPETQALAVDHSAEALAIAKHNAHVNDVEDRIVFHHGNWLAAWDHSERFELIVSNPPYIPTGDIATLESSVRDYDPILALDGGIDGFDSLRAVLATLDCHLNHNGVALLEIGFDQQDEMARLVSNHDLTLSAIHPDMAGIPRVAEIRHGDK